MDFFRVNSAFEYKLLETRREFLRGNILGRSSNLEATDADVIMKVTHAVKKEKAGSRDSFLMKIWAQLGDLHLDSSHCSIHRSVLVSYWRLESDV